MTAVEFAREVRAEEAVVGYAASRIRSGAALAASGVPAIHPASGRLSGDLT